jgi:hypothetical protein
LVLFFVGNSYVLVIFLVVKFLSMCTNHWMKILGQNLATIKIFNTLGHSNSYSKEYQNKWETIYTLILLVFPPTHIVFPWYGLVYSIMFNIPWIVKQYEMSIGNIQTYIYYMDFITVMASSLNGQGKWMHLEHIYYILQHVMYCV